MLSFDPSDIVGLLFFKATLVLVGAAVYTFLRKNDLKNVDKSFISLLIVYFTIKAIQKNYHHHSWVKTGEYNNSSEQIEPSFLFKILILINAKKINKETTQMIILKIISSLLAFFGKGGFLPFDFSFVISIAIESYLFYLIPNKNIFDAIYLPIKSILSYLIFKDVIKNDNYAILSNIIDIAEAFYFVKIVNLDK